MDNIAAFKQQLERNMVAMRIGWSDLLPRKFEAHKPCSDIHILKLHALG